MKSQNNQFNNKLLISEVIKLLLYIYNMNKSALNRENVIIVSLPPIYLIIESNRRELPLDQANAPRTLPEAAGSQGFIGNWRKFHQ
jgi:hypothetical protein